MRKIFPDEADFLLDRSAKIEIFTDGFKILYTFARTDV